MRGDEVSDRYVRLRLLGEGSTGRVWLAQDRLSAGRTVALKELIEGGQRREANIRHEFATLSTLRHPNIVDALDFDLAPDTRLPRFSLEYVDGVEFTTAVGERGPSHLLDLVAEALRALGFLHDFGLIHRDLKPPNLLVRNLPRHGCSLAIVDFGLAFESRDAPAGVVGTLPYVAPEILEGGPPTALSDMYALGAVVHESVWGHPPVVLKAGETAGQFIERLRSEHRQKCDLPPEHAVGLNTWLDAMLSFDPSERPATASEAIARLNAACGTEYVDETETSRSARLASGMPLGRRSELDRIWRFLAPGEVPRVILLSGEAGVGKSRMIRWLGAEAVRKGWEVHSRVAELMSDSGRDAVPDDVLPRLGPAAASGAVLVLIDGLESASSAVVDIVDRVARGFRDSTVQLVAALRPSEVRVEKLKRLLVDCPWMANAERVNLGPLGKESVEEFVKRASASRGLSSQRVSWLAQASEGSPLLLEGLLVKGAWETRDEVETPPTIVDSVAHRLATVSPSARNWLTSLAVLGDNTPEKLVQELSGFDADEAEQALAETTLAGLVSRDRDTCSFGSKIVSDYVRNTLDRKTKQALYEKAARVVEESGMGEASPGRLARIWREAGRTDESVHRAIEAAEREQELSRPEESADWYRFALSQLPRRDRRRRVLRARHADALAASGYFEAALRALGTVLRLTPVESERAEVLAKRSYCLMRTGRFLHALHSAECAVHLADKHGLEATAARARNAVGRTMVRLERQEDAIPVFLDAADRSVHCGDLQLQAQSVYMAGACASELRRLDEARQRLGKALELAQQCGDYELAAQTLIGTGIVERRASRNEKALEYFERADRVITKHDLLSQRPALLASIGVALEELGRYDEALRVDEEAIAWSQRAGDRHWTLQGKSLRANLLLIIGRPSEAAEECTALLQQFASRVEPKQRGYLMASLAEALTETQHPDTRRIGALIAEAFSLAGDDPKLAVATKIIELERRNMAKEPFEPAYAEYVAARTQSGSALEPPLEIRAELARSEALLNEAKPADAAAVAEAAAALAETKDVPALAARAKAVVAKAFRQMGRADRAGPAMQDARRLLQVAADRIGDEEMRRSFLARPVFRDIRKAAAEPTSGEQRLLAIYDMLRVLNSETDPDELLESMLDMALQVVQAERGLILLREGAGDGEYVVRLARNLEKQTIRDAAEFSRNVVLRAGTGKSVLAIDTEEDDRLKDLKSVSLFGIRSVLCVPLRSRTEIIGAVYLDNRKAGALFNQDDLRFLEAFADHAALALENAWHRRELELENRRLRVAADERVSFDNLIGRSAPMQSVYDLIPRLAESHLPVLIQGESGTGKELVARSTHAHSPRTRKPFLSENCAAIPETLLESELFGHVRGAFTGADRDRPGLFEQAHTGTLFLDEIGDMSASMQARLLRVLQEGELRRVGGQRTVQVDVRVITATHRDLQVEVAAGRFREDLLYRLQVLVIELPPLRERIGDVPLLVDHFLRRISRERGRPVPKVRSNVMSLLERYTWPGNVRQLENHIQRLVLLAGEGPITAAVVESDKGLRETLLGERTEETPMFSLEHGEREKIRQALAATQGNRTRAAKLLGISRATIFRRIKEYDL